MARRRTDGGGGGELSSGSLASACRSAAEQLRSLLIPCVKTNTAENVKNHRVTQSVRSSYCCRADGHKPAARGNKKITFILQIHTKPAAETDYSTDLSFRLQRKHNFVDELGHFDVPLRQPPAVVGRQCDLDLWEQKQCLLY